MIWTILWLAYPNTRCAEWMRFIYEGVLFWSTLYSWSLMHTFTTFFPALFLISSVHTVPIMHEWIHHYGLCRHRVECPVSYWPRLHTKVAVFCLGIIASVLHENVCLSVCLSPRSLSMCACVCVSLRVVGRPLGTSVTWLLSADIILCCAVNVYFTYIGLRVYICLRRHLILPRYHPTNSFIMHAFTREHPS